MDWARKRTELEAMLRSAAAGGEVLTPDGGSTTKNARTVLGRLFTLIRATTAREKEVLPEHGRPGSSSEPVALLRRLVFPFADDPTADSEPLTTVSYLTSSCMQPFDPPGVHRLENRGVAGATTNKRTTASTTKPEPRKHCSRHMFSVEKLWETFFQTRFNPVFHDYGSYDYGQVLLSREQIHKYSRDWYRWVVERGSRTETFALLPLGGGGGGNRGPTGANGWGRRSTSKSFLSHRVDLQGEAFLPAVGADVTDFGYHGEAGQGEAAQGEAAQGEAGQGEVKPGAPVEQLAGARQQVENDRNVVSRSRLTNRHRFTVEKRRLYRLEPTHRSLVYIMEHFYYVLYGGREADHYRNYLTKTSEKTHIFDMRRWLGGISSQSQSYHPHDSSASPGPSPHDEDSSPASPHGLYATPRFFDRALPLGLRLQSLPMAQLGNYVDVMPWLVEAAAEQRGRAGPVGREPPLRPEDVARQELHWQRMFVREDDKNANASLEHDIGDADIMVSAAGVVGNKTVEGGGNVCDLLGRTLTQGVDGCRRLRWNMNLGRMHL